MIEFMNLSTDLQCDIFYRLHVFDRLKLAHLVLPRGYADRVLYKRRAKLASTDAGISEDMYLALLVRGLREGCDIKLDVNTKFVISRMEPCDPTVDELISYYRQQVEWLVCPDQRQHWELIRLIENTKKDDYFPSGYHVGLMLMFLVESDGKNNFTALLQQMAFMKPSSFVVFAQEIQRLYTSNELGADERRTIEWDTEDSLYIWIIIFEKNVSLLQFLHSRDGVNSLPGLFQLQRIKNRCVFEGFGLRLLVKNAEGIRMFFEFNPDASERARKRLFEWCLQEDYPKKDIETSFNTCILAAKYLTFPSPPHTPGAGGLRPP